jgi:hypothetical protein
LKVEQRRLGYQSSIGGTDRAGFLWRRSVEEEECGGGEVWRRSVEEE